MSNRIKSFLDRRHPGYADMEGHWSFLQQTFSGGPLWMNEGNLFKFHKEGPGEYKARKSRAFRDNLTRQIVEVRTAHLFKPGIKRDESKASESLKKFIGRATKGLNQMSLTEFMSLACTKAAATQVVWIVVDMPEAPEGLEVLTVQNARDANLKPYAYQVFPTDVLDFGVDIDGELTWVLIREAYRDDSDPMALDGATKTQYRLWDKVSWRVFEETKSSPGFVEVGSGNHPCNRVPVIRLVHKEGDDIYHPIGQVDEIAYKDRTIANDESRLDTIICDQTFNTLWIPDAGLIANTEKDAEGKRRKFIQAATNRAALFHDKANHAPFYLSPDGSAAQTINDRIVRLRSECWEDALMGMDGREKSGGPLTATEAEQRFEKINATLSAQSRGVEAAERGILQLAALWNGESLDDESLASLSTYPRKFDIKALLDEVTELQGFQKFSQLGATFWELSLMSIIKRKFPDATDEEIEEMRNEIWDNVDTNSMLAAGAQFQSNLEMTAASLGTGDKKVE